MSERWRDRTGRRGALSRWLRASGSLSARLAGPGAAFAVQVLRQGRAPVSADESRALATRERVAHVREVLLCLNQRPVVYARSVCLHRAALGAWRAVRGLGVRPLADVLFRRSGIGRGALEFARLHPAGPLRRRLGRAEAAWRQTLPLPKTSAPGADDAGPADDISWRCDRPWPRAPDARRSAFVRRGQSLLVMEVFVAAPARRPPARSVWRQDGPRWSGHETGARQ